MTPSLHATAFTTSVVGTVAAATVARAITLALDLDSPAPIVAAAVFAAAMGVASARVGRFHPHARFGAANLVTSVRLLLTALVWGLAVEPPAARVAAAAVGLGLLTTALDGADGWLARSYRTASAFGARFDMEVDALLIMALSTLAWSQGKAGVWVLLSGVMRYAFVASAWIAPWMERPLPPSRRRQTTCVLQIIGLIIAIAPVVRHPLSAGVAAVALGVLTWSFAGDCLWLWRHAAEPLPVHARRP
jgi:phosphatidylglycerophosphate synthase